ncbi:isoleucyl-tRNA synthetase [Babesia caballi]|uniref:isoleucine--tRNA ligase n=1 Tax=Babesia caballi TaxID=5871 RepID=A0AAV4LXQ9_BABCB|nr:isoleucyl-tRNA synthetase [Babesia caballi]
MWLRGSALAHLVAWSLLTCSCYVLRHRRGAPSSSLALEGRPAAPSATHDGGRRWYGWCLGSNGADEGYSSPDAAAIERTLNLPKTLWPKRKNFNRAAIERQIRIQKFWRDHDVYRMLLERRLAKFESKGLSDAKATQRTTVILDGPPYANGAAHYGHFLNKTIKDVLLRAALLDGRLSLFLPGWDCHGIPIESKVLSASGCNLGDLRSGLTDAGVPRAVEMRQRCSQVATRSIQAQTAAFERSGVWGLWRDFYATYHFYYERRVMEAFQTLLDRRLIYRARCPQHFSSRSGSVLADSELLTEPRDVLTAFVGFKLLDAAPVLEALNFHRPLADVRLVCWTTLPWTLPANRGLLLNGSTDYDVFYRDSRLYVMNNNDSFGLFLPKHHVGRLRGSLLLDAAVLNPTTGAEYLVHDHPGIVDDKGTGIVHAAPAHGFVDFRLLSSLGGLSVSDSFVADPAAICNVIDEDERFYAGVHPLLDGTSIHELDSARLQNLLGDLLLRAEVQRLPVDVDWRFGNRTHVRLTKQWCLSLRDRTSCLPQLDEVKMYPNASRNYLRNIVAHRSRDWCLSRQRVWGTPIPVAYVGLDALRNEGLAKLCSPDDRFDGAWAGEYRVAVDIETLPPYELGDRVFRKLDFRADTVDVWFESALAQRVTIDRLREILAELCRRVAPQSGYTFRGLAADYAVEGHDQFRGWYQSSLLVNTLLGTDGGPALARRLITHGFVNDSSGRKFSKRNQASPPGETPSKSDKAAESTASCVTTPGEQDCNGRDTPDCGRCLPQSGPGTSAGVGSPSGLEEEVGRVSENDTALPPATQSSMDLMQMLGGEYYDDPELVDLDSPKSVGADVLRLWVCSNEFLQKDIQLSQENLAEARNFARKIANFFKYVIGVTHDCKVRNDRCRIRVERFSGLDLHFLKLSFALVRDARRHFREGGFHKIVRALGVFLTRFSNVYVSYNKDTLYCDVRHGWRRTCAQIIMRKILRNVLGVVAPMMPHMAEDVFQETAHVRLPVLKRRDASSLPSVFGIRWERMPLYLRRVDVASRVERALQLRGLVNSSALQRDDVELLIVCDNEQVLQGLLDLETNLQIDLRLLLGVAEVRLTLRPPSDAAGPPLRGDGCSIYFFPTAYSKCRRCWLYREDVSSGFCFRCAAICSAPIPEGDSVDSGTLGEAGQADEGPADAHESTTSNVFDEYVMPDDGEVEEGDDDGYGYDDQDDDGIVESDVNS